MSLELKDGSVTEDPRLDRLVEFDERSREFRVGSLVPAERPRERIWHLGHSRMGDQGQEGACVEFGIMHSALTLPKMAAITVGCRRRWPGSDAGCAHPAMRRLRAPSPRS